MQTFFSVFQACLLLLPLVEADKPTNKKSSKFDSVIFISLEEHDDDSLIARIIAPDGSKFQDVFLVSKAAKELGAKHVLLYIPEPGFVPKISHQGDERIFGVRFRDSEVELFTDGLLGFDACHTLADFFLSHPEHTQMRLRSTMESPTSKKSKKMRTESNPIAR